jgi:hypothetical protein
MHTIERFHRDGNTLTWTVTVEDPDVLLQPWTSTPRVAVLNRDPRAMLPEVAALLRTRFGHDRYERTPLIMMSTKTRTLHISAIAVASMFLCWSVAARAQGTADPTNQLRVLRAAATALGQIRMSDIGVTNPPCRSSTSSRRWRSPAAASSIQWPADECDIYRGVCLHSTAMRVEIKGEGGGNAVHTIQTVREEYAWNESEKARASFREKARPRQRWHPPNHGFCSSGFCRMAS